jgi:hypothetical protein
VLSVEVVQTAGENGPASVVRVVEDEDMEQAARRLVERLQLSGFVGLDFVIDQRNGRPQLIEVNMRATQIGHLRLGSGRDLTAALCQAATGEHIGPLSAYTEQEFIALFPQEWLRDPCSEYLRTAYHDVPWEIPGLVRLATSRDWRATAWSAAAAFGRRLGASSDRFEVSAKAEPGPLETPQMSKKGPL